MRSPDGRAAAARIPDRNRPARASLSLLGILTAAALPAGLLVYLWAGARAAGSAALGAGLAAALSLAGLWLVAWAFGKQQKVFLASLAGGFLGRMVIFCSALTLLVLRSDLPPGAFVAGFFGAYVICQAVEIRSVHRRAIGGEAGA